MNRCLLPYRFALLLCALVAFSCRESEAPIEETEYFLKFKANGELVEYKVYEYQPVVFSYDPNGKTHNAQIQALAEGSDGTRDFFSIFLYSEMSFEEKTYQMQEGVWAYENSFLPGLIFTRSDPAGNLYNASLLKSDYPTLDIRDDGSLNLTQIGSGWVKGAFEASLFGPFAENTSRGNTEIRITEGSFKMKLIQNPIQE
ncbi:hypothetical protein [Cyclobacterium salsum]|uniref:hypothetical protein n=1 Tax=Cyclobacterium salsum TaxID=2666329 RepID=UPI0013920699|nr:hypothetical protein [Cyclobacterium salsum]